MTVTYTKRLTGNYNAQTRTNKAFDCGYSLSVHGRIHTDGEYERTGVGSLIYRAKYQQDREAVNELALLMSQHIATRLAEMGEDATYIHAIIPAPPSNLDRSFQPVYEIAKLVAEHLGIRYDEELVRKAQGSCVKQMEGYSSKYPYVRERLTVVDRRYQGKRLLVVDDIIDSGATLDAIAATLKDSGATSVYVMVATSTISKK